MDWKFWKNRNKSEEHMVIEELRDQTVQIHGKSRDIEKQLFITDERIGSLSRQSEENEELINKAMRLQYKTSQDLLHHLKNLEIQMEVVREWQNQYDRDLAEKQILRLRLEKMTDAYIQWIDELDIVCEKIYENGQDSWQQLLRMWQTNLLNTLAQMGIQEIAILGHSFDPSWAEAVDTVVPKADRIYEPYEVVEVVKRGYIREDGRLVRKARVVTIREVEKNNEQE